MLRAVNVTRLGFRDNSAFLRSCLLLPRKHSNSSGVCYTKPIDSLKHWNDHFFWVDAFACPVSCPWQTDKNVSRDPLPNSTEFNVDHYAFLVAHLALFRKFPEPFLCLVGMNRYYTLDEDTYPMFLHDDEKGGCLCLYIVYLVVFDLVFNYLFVYAEMDLLAFIHVADPTKASVDKLFDESCDTDQGDSAAGGGHDAEIEPVTAFEDTAAGNMTAERPKCPRKKRAAVADASGSSHPPKKLKGITELLVELLLAVVATLPLVTSSVSATPEHECGYPTDSIIGANLRTIGQAESFVISSYSSHHSSTNAPEPEVDSIIRSTILPSVMTEAVISTSVASAPSVPVPRASAIITPRGQPSIFHNSSSVGTVKPDVVGPSSLLGKELSIGSQEINSVNLHEVFVPHWNVPNDTLLDDHNISKEFIDHLAPPARDGEIESLKAQLLLKEAEAAEVASLRVQDLELKDFDVTVSSLMSQNDGLVDQVHELEATCFGLCDQVLSYESLKKQIEAFQDAQMKILNDKVAKLDADLFEMALHLDEKFYPHLLTTISAEGKSLEDVASYNPAVEADYNFTLQRLREVDFPLLAELWSHKDASFEDIINLLRLEGPLADAPGMSEIRESVAAQRSSLVDAMVPLVKPLSMEKLTGAVGTSGSVPITAVTTALSTTFTEASLVPSVSVDDYEVIGADDQGDVPSFPTVDFEKEDLDTTPKHDPPT
nr:hypothetical protein [Tanacetum cinerariifolium]